MTKLLLRDLSPGTTYYVQLRALDGGRESAWSHRLQILTGVDSTAPSLPTAVAWSSVGRSFVGTWTAPATDSGGGPLYDFDKFQVKITFVAGGTSVTYDTQGTRFDFTYEMNEAKFGTAKSPLNFEVRSIDTLGNASAWTTPVTATNPIPGTVALSAIAGVESIGLEWIAPSDLDLVGFNIYASQSNGFTPGAGNKVSQQAGLTYTLFTQSVSAWYFHVRAVDIFGQEGPSTQATATARATISIDTTPPSGPTSVTTAVGFDATRQQAYITATWVASISTDVRNYTIRYAPTAASNWNYVTVNNDVTTTRIDVDAGTAYYLSIQAIDWTGNKSAFVNSATYPHTTPADTTAPSSTPTLSMSGAIKTLMCSWNEATDIDVKNAAGMYEIQIATDNGFTANLQTSKVSTLMTSFANLVSNTLYYGRVRAVDSSGNAGSWSTTASTTIGQATSADITVGSIYTDRLVVGALEENIIPNGGFDEQAASFVPWTVAPAGTGTWAMESTITNSSAYAIKCTHLGTAANDFISTKAIPVKAGDKYTLTMSTRASAGAVTNFYLIAVFNTVEAGTWDWSTTPANTYWKQNSQKEMTTTVVIAQTLTTTYTDHTCTFTVPAGMKFLKIQPLAQCYSAGVITYIDGFSLRRMVGNAQIIDASIDTAHIQDLAVTNAKINTLEAGKLTADSAIIADLTLGRSADALGSMKSFGYVAGTTGFKLNKTQLEINDGTILARTLQLRSAANLMPSIYTDFEAPLRTYMAQGIIASKFYLENCTISMSSTARFGIQSLKITSAAGPFVATFSSDIEAYNVAVEGGREYIVSAYVLSDSTNKPTVGFGVLWDNGTSSVEPSPVATTTTWVRRSYKFTAPLDAEKATLFLTNNHASVSSFNVDGVQFEEKIGKLDTPTQWNPSSSTTIDGGQIKTGSLQSNALTTVAGVGDVPAWFIDVNGTAQFSDATVLGRLRIGTPSEIAGASSIESANYSQVAGSESGWKIDSAGVARLNDAVIHGDITSQNASVTESLSVSGVGGAPSIVTLGNSSTTTVAGPFSNPTTPPTVIASGMETLSFPSLPTSNVYGPAFTGAGDVNFLELTKLSKMATTSTFLYEAGVGTLVISPAFAQTCTIANNTTWAGTAGGTKSIALTSTTAIPTVQTAFGLSQPITPVASTNGFEVSVDVKAVQTTYFYFVVGTKYVGAQTVNAGSTATITGEFDGDTGDISEATIVGAVTGVTAALAFHIDNFIITPKIDTIQLTNYKFSSAAAPISTTTVDSNITIGPAHTPECYGFTSYDGTNFTAVVNNVSFNQSTALQPYTIHTLSSAWAITATDTFTDTANYDYAYRPYIFRTGTNYYVARCKSSNNINNAAVNPSFESTSLTGITVLSSYTTQARIANTLGTDGSWMLRITSNTASTSSRGHWRFKDTLQPCVAGDKIVVRATVRAATSTATGFKLRLTWSNGAYSDVVTTTINTSTNTVCTATFTAPAGVTGYKDIAFYLYKNSGSWGSPETSYYIDEEFVTNNGQYAWQGPTVPYSATTGSGDAGKFYIRKYTAGALTTITQENFGHQLNSHITGFTVGNGDFANSTFSIYRAMQPETTVDGAFFLNYLNYIDPGSTTGVTLTNRDARYGVGKGIGIYSNRYWSYFHDSKTIQQWAKTYDSHSSRKLSVAYTYYDSDATGSTHETSMSPVTTYDYGFNLRNKITVSNMVMPTIPGGVAATDTPNQIGVYYGYNTTDRTKLTRVGYYSLTGGAVTLTIDDFTLVPGATNTNVPGTASSTAANPSPATNGFASVAGFTRAYIRSGQEVSGSPSIIIGGDGVGNIQGLAFSSSGLVLSPGLGTAAGKLASNTGGFFINADGTGEWPLRTESHIALKQSAVTAIGNGATVKITSFGTTIDAGVGVTYANGDWTVTSAGLYLVVGNLQIGAGAAAGNRWALLYINGVEELRTQATPNTSTNSIPISMVRRLAANDVVSLYGSQTSGASLNTNTATNMSVTRLAL